MQLDLQTIGAILEITAVIVGILGAAWYAFFGAKNNQEAQGQAVSRNLIDNLQTSLDLTNVKLETTTKELHQMQGRNSVLEDLFKGNEGSIISTLKMIPELVASIRDSNAIAKSNADSVAKMATGIAELVGALAPLKAAPQFEIKS